MSYLLISYHIQEMGSEGLSKLSYSEESRDRQLLDLKENLGAKELFHLATCNRVEYLFHTDNLEELLENINTSKQLPLDTARFFSSKESVVQHLLEVALSMDSMIFGENQILGQLKTAYQESLKFKSLGPQTSGLIQEILKHAKKIRSETKLRNIHTSVATVAAREFTERGSKTDKILFIGAGETNQLAARYLHKYGFRNFVWCNRSAEKAKQMAKSLGGDTLSFKDMLEAKTPKVDAVFLATNAGKVIFSEKQFLTAKPNQVFDLSIPNNASKEDSEKHSCRYIGVEHLGEILAKEEAKYLQLKDSLAKKIKKSLKEISQFLDEKRLSPVITESLENIDQILKSAMDQLPKELQNLDQQQTEALRLWTRRLVKKAKHEHIQQLKKLKKSGATG